MFRRFSVNFAIFTIVVDAVVIVLALGLALYLRPFMNALPFVRFFQPPIRIPSTLYPIFAIAWVTILLLFSVYDGRRNIRLVDELTTLTLGSILAGVSLAGTLYLSYREVSRALFLTFFIIAFLALLAWRLVARIVFRLRNIEAKQTRKVLIIGAGPVGKELQEKINRLPDLALVVVGFLDDNPNKRTEEKDILGYLAEAHDVVATKGIDDVVIALPRRAYERVNQLVAELHDLPVKVWVIPDYFHLALHKAIFEEFAGIPMLDLRAPALNDNQRLFKRGFDLFLTLISLPVALVTMSLIGLAIRLESPGPILFKQHRMGENGRIFGMIKFRTMVPNAENLRHLVEKTDNLGHLIHKFTDDPRVTRIGRFLRRTSLDELPQIFNVIMGDMSLVGPRPELPYLVEKYEPWQRKRFAVPQGITGWWQVNGRSDKPMHLHTEDDLYYVQNYSLLLDLQILLKTVWVVTHGGGAF